MPKALVEDIFFTTLNANIFSAVKEYINLEVQNKGISYVELISTLCDIVIKSENNFVTEAYKKEIIMTSAIADYNLRNGGDGYIQLMCVLSKIFNLKDKKFLFNRN